MMKQVLEQAYESGKAMSDLVSHLKKRVEELDAACKGAGLVAILDADPRRRPSQIRISKEPRSIDNVVVADVSTRQGRLWLAQSDALHADMTTAMEVTTPAEIDSVLTALITRPEVGSWILDAVK